MRTREGVQFQAARDDRGAFRKILDPALEIVPVGARLGFVRYMRLDRAQAFPEPMPAPGQALGLGETELTLQELADARHDERMRVAGDDLREPAHAGAAARVG